MLILRWRAVAPALTLAWAGPSGEMSATAQSDMSSVAAIVGPQGPSGAAMAGYEYIQDVASALWTVNHNLGRWPASVMVTTPGQVVVEAAPIFTSSNQLTIEFAIPFAGRARII
jgi:hypothetical protein